jgi:hypothetical protein
MHEGLVQGAQSQLQGLSWAVLRCENIETVAQPEREEMILERHRSLDHGQLLTSKRRPTELLPRAARRVSLLA